MICLFRPPRLTRRRLNEKNIPATLFSHCHSVVNDVGHSGNGLLVVVLRAAVRRVAKPGTTEFCQTLRPILRQGIIFSRVPWRKPKDLKAVFSGCALKNSGENLGRRANPAMQDLKYLTDQ